MTSDELDTKPKIPIVNEKKADASQPSSQIMVEVADASQIRNPWICQNCGAILGSVYQEKIRQGLSVSRLILFRNAVKLGESLPTAFVFGKVDAGEFGCSRCGTVRHFHPSPEALRVLAEGKRYVVRKRNRNL